MGHGGEVEEGSDLQFSPIWFVALVCTVIVAVSFAVECSLHYLDKILKKKNKKSLFQALRKIKELMLLGFISLFLTVTQNGITKICVPKDWTLHMLPCSLEEKEQYEESKLSTNDVFGNARRLLVDAHSSNYQEHGYCATKGKVPMVPLLSMKALHHLHVFVFVLAVVHVTSCVLIIVFGGLNIHRWKHWEDSIVADENQSQHVTHVHQHAFIKDHFTGFGEDSAIRGWLQFYGSVTRVDYVTLRLGFIMTHCRGNPKFNFHKYMNRVLEDDFKKVVGISWYLWIFVVIFLLLNINEHFGDYRSNVKLSLGPGMQPLFVPAPVAPPMQFVTPVPIPAGSTGWTTAPPRHPPPRILVPGTGVFLPPGSANPSQHLQGTLTEVNLGVGIPTLTIKENGKSNHNNTNGSPEGKMNGNTERQECNGNAGGTEVEQAIEEKGENNGETVASH